MNSVPLLSVRGLSKRFGGLLAVDGLDFDLKAGEVLAVIGPNGAGKTTTFGLVCGAIRPSAGSISFENRRIDGLPPHKVARLGIFRTFQHNMAFKGMSVVDNILIGAHRRFSKNLFSVIAGTGRTLAAEKRERQRAIELAQFVGLGDWLGADVATLSFGQGRLLEIARALAGEPKVLFLDEPAAGLTPVESTRLFAIVKDVAARGIAVLLIEHDMHFLMPLADRVVVLNFGRKIAEGTPTQIRAEPQVVEAYLGDLAKDRTSVEVADAPH